MTLDLFGVNDSKGGTRGQLTGGTVRVQVANFVWAVGAGNEECEALRGYVPDVEEGFVAGGGYYATGFTGGTVQGGTDLFF